MGSSRETAHQLTDSNVAGARKVREQWDAAGARLYNAFEDNTVHAMAAMREIGHRMLVATDTNVRATLDFAERVAKAADARKVAAPERHFHAGTVAPADGTDGRSPPDDQRRPAGEAAARTETP